MFGIFAYFLSPAVRRWRQQCPKGVCRCRPALSHPSYGGRSCSCGWTKQVNWNTYVRGCVPILQNCGDFPDSIWLTFNNRTSKGSVYGVPLRQTSQSQLMAMTAATANILWCIMWWICICEWWWICRVADIRTSSECKSIPLKTWRNEWIVCVCVCVCMYACMYVRLWLCISWWLQNARVEIVEYRWHKRQYAVHLSVKRQIPMSWDYQIIYLPMIPNSLRLRLL